MLGPICGSRIGCCGRLIDRQLAALEDEDAVRALGEDVLASAPRPVLMARQSTSAASATAPRRRRRTRPGRPSRSGSPPRSSPGRLSVYRRVEYPITRRDNSTSVVPTEVLRMNASITPEPKPDSTTGPSASQPSQFVTFFCSQPVMNLMMSSLFFSSIIMWLLPRDADVLEAHEVGLHSRLIEELRECTDRRRGDRCRWRHRRDTRMFFHRASLRAGSTCSQQRASSGRSDFCSSTTFKIRRRARRRIVLVSRVGQPP